MAEAATAIRVVDLFAGSGAVAWFAAERTNRPVFAYDLQRYSAVLARCVISRGRPLDAEILLEGWLRGVERELGSEEHAELARFEGEPFSARTVARAREACEKVPGGPIWQAYGGHYFSPRQARALDLALWSMPDGEPARSVAHASVIAAASYCAASPGHTAQPFQPTPTSLPHIAQIWRRDPLAKIDAWVRDVCRRHANRVGEAGVADALAQANQLSSGDLVIVDPPYSAVQYSRFYHVLETIANGRSVDVSGTGRYPPVVERPVSDFSLKSRSEHAVVALLDALAAADCRVLLTFPAGESSNGLSGARVAELAKKRFRVTSRTVLGRFSTLGGNNTVRASRRVSAELILRMAPA